MFKWLDQIYPKGQFSVYKTESKYDDRFMYILINLCSLTKYFSKIKKTKQNLD